MPTYDSFAQFHFREEHDPLPLNGVFVKFATLRKIVTLIGHSVGTPMVGIGMAHCFIGEKTESNTVTAQFGSGLVLSDSLI